jgi:hypothetical protein
LFAEICSLIQPCRPKNDLVRPACEAEAASDLVRGQPEVLGLRIGHVDLIRRERSAHDIPHQRYMNAIAEEIFKQLTGESGPSDGAGDRN